jgi:heme-degrading monooxygenase HmoA
MYVMIRRTGLVGSPDEVVQRTRDHIVPLVQGRPGFLGYCGFVTENGDAAYSISIFDDRATAMDAHQRVRQYIDANMRALMPAEPEVTAGETVFHELVQPQEQRRDSQKPLFVVIRIYSGLPGQTETMHSLVSQHTLPAIMNAPGFRGFYTFRDEEDSNRAISITLFETRDEAMRTHERVVEIMREQLGELAYRVPKVVAGETVVLATA